MNKNKHYRARVGLNWIDRDGKTERRAEPGEDVPAYVVRRSAWIVEQALVEEIDEPGEDA